MIHGGPQRFRGGAPTQSHARGVNDVARMQLSTTGHRGLPNFHRAVRVAFFLNRRPSTASDGARHTASEDQVIVRSIDDGVDVLLDEVACDDQDSRRSHASTLATRSSNSLRVAFAMPFTPIAEMVIDAQATPHTSASCRPVRRPPVLNQRASIPPANASPAPVVSTTGGSVTAGIRTTPSSTYAARPSAPALMTSPCSHHCRRNSSGSLPPSAANSSWLQKNQAALRNTSLAS